LTKNKQKVRGKTNKQYKKKHNEIAVLMPNRTQSD